MTITSKKKNWNPWDARSITKWTEACDKRLSFITHVITNTIVMWETLPNNADWDCFKTPILQEILRIQSLRQVEHCAFSEVIRLFQPVGCLRNKLQFRTVQQNQKSFPWMEDWGWTVYPRLIYGIWSSEFFTETRIRVIKNGEAPCTNFVRVNPHKLPARKKIHGKIDDLDNVDFISSNVNSSRNEALIYIFEDNEAVIKMIIKGRSHTMRHVSRTHRVALDWLFDRINSDPKIQIKYIDTNNQLADILTKGNFTRDEWNHLLFLFDLSHFSSVNNLEAMSKRTQKDVGEERVTAKSKPMMNLVSRFRVRDPNVLASTAFRCTGENQNLKVRKYFWARWLSSNQEQGDPYWAPAHQTTQNGTLTTSGLLKSGNLVKCWEQERGDPWVDKNPWERQVCHRWWWCGLWHTDRTFRWMHDHYWTGWMIDGERYWTILR